MKKAGFEVRLECPSIRRNVEEQRSENHLPIKLAARQVIEVQLDPIPSIRGAGRA
jgi:hypothetical protein